MRHDAHEPLSFCQHRLLIVVSASASWSAPGAPAIAHLTDFTICLLLDDPRQMAGCRYTVSCWYWEVIELLKKFVLTSVLSFVEPGTATQARRYRSCLRLVRLKRHLLKGAGRKRFQSALHIIMSQSNS